MKSIKTDSRKLFKWSEVTAESDTVQMRWSVEPIPFTVEWYYVRLFVSMDDGEQFEITAQIERFPYRRNVRQLLGHAGLNYDCFSQEFGETARALEAERCKFCQQIDECPF